MTSGTRVARVAVFAGLVAVLGLTPALSVPAVSVPVTVQTLGVMIAGLMLPPVEAFLSLALFVGLVASGLPLLSGGRGGAAIFAGASAGFVSSWPLAAATVSACAYLLTVATRRWPHVTHRRRRLIQFPTFLASSVIGGIGVVYAIGIPVGSAVADIPLGTFFRGSLSFLPGDLAKAIAASVIVVGVLRSAPFLSPRLASARRM